MANLFLHRMPLSQGGFKYTIICSNDISDTIGTFLQENFEIEVIQSGRKTALRSETRFELDIQDEEKIEKLNNAFRSEENVREEILSQMNPEEKAEYHKQLLSAFSLN